MSDDICWYWCEGCGEFVYEEDPCDCELEIDLDASPAWLRRLNPDLDIGSYFDDN